LIPKEYKLEFKSTKYDYLWRIHLLRHVSKRIIRVEATLPNILSHWRCRSGVIQVTDCFHCVPRNSVEEYFTWWARLAVSARLFKMFFRGAAHWQPVLILRALFHAKLYQYRLIRSGVLAVFGHFGSQIVFSSCVRIPQSESGRENAPGAASWVLT
jgi:hypothetical protein